MDTLPNELLCEISKRVADPLTFRKACLAIPSFGYLSLSEYLNTCFQNALTIETEPGIFKLNGQFHRNDGPAVTKIINNIKRLEYYQYGQLHRDDGPAVLQYYENGNKEREEYWINGKSHRDPIEEDGVFRHRPAATQWLALGRKYGEWYRQYGIYHRTDGPAVIVWRDADVTENPYLHLEWRFNNQKHRIDGPAIVVYNRLGTLIHEEWQFEGRRHRLDDLPAVIVYNPNGVKLHERYWINGRRHRIGGPAATQWRNDGTKHGEWYWQNDKYHRLPSTRPAITIYHLNGIDIAREEWKCRGMSHRINDPAVKVYAYVNGVNKLCREEWIVNDKKHRTDGPAIITYWNFVDNNTEESHFRHVEWWINNELHRPVHGINTRNSRPAGPSVTVWNPAGKKLFERWHKYGITHRDHKEGSAITIWWDSDTLRSQSYVTNGKQHNPNAPAIIEYYRNGSKSREEWRIEGKLHCDNGPATIIYHINGKVLQEGWYNNDRLHRSAIDSNGNYLPAKIIYDENGLIIEYECWVDGELISESMDISD